MGRKKGHLSGIKEKGIDACTSVPKDVQEASRSTFDNSNKRPYNRVNSSNLEHNFVNSNLPSDLSKGNAEHLQRAAIEDSNQNIMRNVNSGHPEVNCFNFNQNIMRNVNSSDPQENCLNSNQSIMRNIYLGDPEENFLSFNQGVMRNTYSGYLEENFLNSNQSVIRNINSSDISKGKSITGREKDRFWQYVETSMDGKFNKCNFCGHEFVGGASRIKWHLSKTEKMGVDICSNVSEDVQKAAYDASNKRLKRNIDSNHIEENFVNSNSLSSSSKGNAELYQMPTSTNFIGKQFQSYIDTIWGWLMKDEESVIGVCGMGGVGKTTLLKHIYNKLLDASRHVIWVDVPCSVFQLQKAIADSCDLHLLDTDGMTKIAAKLLHAFKKIKKCVIILDDVWDDIHLESVGIPLTNSEVQVIIASRMSNVCRTMGCKMNILEVKPLWKLDDCWDLFFKVLGKDELMLPNEAIAKFIIIECYGLPLAIVTMARSMKEKEDIREWKHIWKNLRHSIQDDMKKSVFPRLTLSYNRLNDKILQEGLLLCALYFKFHKWISRDDLIMHFVDEGLIDGKKSLKAQSDEGHIILNKLINSRLLLKVGEQYVDVHRLFRAMAISIANENEGYMLKISKDLREVPPEQEWKESLQKVRLTVEEIPSGTSPRCPKLSSLNLSESKFLKLIPNSFFINMPSLKVLNLLECDGLVHLPTSVSNLESLTSLVLRGCTSLEYVPSLAKLQKLRRLDLSCTAITELPLGLETLINLRSLNLEGTKTLIMSPASVIPKLTNLQVLLLELNTRSMDVKVDDLEGLKVMETISASFCDENEFHAYVRRIVNGQNHRLTSYFLQLVGKPWGYWFNYKLEVYCTEKTIVFQGIGNTDSLLLPVDMNGLIIHKCEEWRSLCDVLSFDDKNNSKNGQAYGNISKCKISTCHKLENVFCSSSSCSFCSSVHSLESLTLGFLKSLSILCKETNVAAITPWGPFSSLRYLYVFLCHRMKTLLTPGMTKHLQNLETLRVEYCDAMEEIFSSERNSDITDVDIDALHIDPIKLPKLKSVILIKLPRLNRVYEGILAFDSLQEFKSDKCPNLKEVPQIQPHFQISVVDDASSDEELSN